MQENKLYQEQIVERLKTGEPLIVEFTKVSTNETRKMTCTLNEDLMPKRPVVTESDHSKPKVVKKPNPAVLNVWDVNAKGWRSFRWENVIKIVEIEE